MAKKTPENEAKARVKDLLDAYRKLGVKMKLTWNAGAAFGPATVDCTGVIAGTSVAFELKRFDGKGKLTARQRLDLREYYEAGAVAMVLDSEQSLDHLRLFLQARLVNPAVPVYRDWSLIP